MKSREGAGRAIDLWGIVGTRSLIDLWAYSGAVGGGCNARKRLCPLCKQCEDHPPSYLVNYHKIDLQMASTKLRLHTATTTTFEGLRWWLEIYTAYKTVLTKI